MSGDFVEVHLFAAARAAAGTSMLQVEPGSMGEVLTRLVAAAPGLAEVLPRCSFLIDGLAVKAASAAHGEGLPGKDDPGKGDPGKGVEKYVPAGSRLDVLPPFAGG